MQEHIGCGQSGFERIGLFMGYIDKIYTGLLVFPFIAVVITLPYVMYQYHKYGSVSWFRTLVIYSFILYMLIAYFQVILPLPSLESTVGNRWQDHLNLIPFYQVWLYWHDKAFSIAELAAYLKSFSLWQLLLNILLTVPFGVYLRYYFKQDLKRTIFFSFLLSLFYELTQLSALYGIYPGPYRLADVEDLICNTMGGAVGWQITYVFTMLLPTRDEIDARSRIAGMRITGMRRFWAALFDYVCATNLYGFLLGLLGILIPAFASSSATEQTYLWTFFCILSLVQVLMTKGSTLGHAICRMTLVSEKGGIASTGQLVKRYLYLWLFTDFPFMIVCWLTSGQFTILNNDLITLGLLVAARLYFFWYFINIVFRKGALMPHDKLSGTCYIQTGKPVK